MAFQDDIAYVAGTPLTWKSSGGTNAITCTTLANAASRQGVKSATLVQVPPGGATAVLPDYLAITLTFKLAVTGTAGNEVSVYLGFSDSATAGTDNPAGLTGADAVGPNSDTFPQLVFAGSVVVSANLTTGAQLAYLAKVPPLDAYVSPVIVNNSGQAFSGTALDTVLTVTPYYRERNT